MCSLLHHHAFISILSSMTSFISSNEIFSPNFPTKSQGNCAEFVPPWTDMSNFTFCRMLTPKLFSRLEVASDTSHRVHFWIYHKWGSLYVKEHHNGGLQIGHTLHLCIYLAYICLYVSILFFSMYNKNIQPCTIGPCSTSWFVKLLLVLQFFYVPSETGYHY